MKNTKYLFTACLFVMMTGNAIAQTPELNDYWQNFVTSGANILSGYTPDTNSLVSTVPERASTVPERASAVPERSRRAATAEGWSLSVVEGTLSRAPAVQKRQ